MDNLGETVNIGITRYQTKTKTNNKKQHKIWICIGYHYTQINTNNVNKTWAFIQTAGGNEEPNIAYMRRSYQTSQHETKKAKAHNWTTQKTKKNEQHRSNQNKPGVNSGTLEG